MGGGKVEGEEGKGTVMWGKEEAVHGIDGGEGEERVDEPEGAGGQEGDQGAESGGGENGGGLECYYVYGGEVTG